MNCDFVVVGSGGAGLSAALAAAVRGARVTVLERSPLLGGTTAISGGGMWIPGNKFMAEQGFTESPSGVVEYLRRLTLGMTSPAVLERYVEAAPELIDFLLEHAPAVPLEGTDTPDYRTNFPGAAPAGRQVATGIYDSKRLGELRDLLRASPQPKGMPPLRHSELQETEWGLGEKAKELDAVVEQRNREGIIARGRALVGSLLEGCAAHGVTFITDARALRLIDDDDGGVTGVVFDHGGKEQRLAAPAGVMLASGGFEWNSEMWLRWMRVPLDGPLSPPFNEGDGIQMAMRQGARISNMTQAWWMPSMAMPGEEYEGRSRVRGAQGDKSLPGAIVVNRSGRRFASESMNYNDFGQMMVAFDPKTYSFPNAPAYVVSDTAHMERYPIAPDLDAAVREGWLFAADDLGRLADQIGVDAGGLKAEVATFNADVSRGADSVFARGEEGWEQYRSDGRFAMGTLATIEKPQFYAYKLGIGCFGTKGGVVIDQVGGVTGFDGKRIRGLYAGGNVAASIFGPGYPGGGATLGPGITFGYLAGSHAVADRASAL